MFLASKKQIPPVLLPLTMGLLIGATFGTMWLVYEVRKEQDAIGELLRVHTFAKIDSLAPFPEELRWQLILTIVLLFVLVSAFVILSLVLRGYLKSQESLQNVQREAGDILESMGDNPLSSLSAPVQMRHQGPPAKSKLRVVAVQLIKQGQRSFEMML